MSAKPRTIFAAVESGTFAGCDHCAATPVGAGATPSCTSRPPSRQTVASASTGRAVRALLHSGASGRCSSAFGFGLADGGRQSPLPERFTFP